VTLVLVGRLLVGGLTVLRVREHVITRRRLGGGLLLHIGRRIDDLITVLVGTPGVASDAEWARQHPETVLRFVSVMFRIIEQEQKEPDLMLKSMLDYVNSFAGTTLDIAGLKMTIETLSPLSNFEFQQNYFDKQNSALYYRTAFDAAVKFNSNKGVLAKG